MHPNRLPSWVHYPKEILSKYKLIIRYYNNKCTIYIYEGKKLTSGLFVLTAIRHGCEIPACFIFLIDMYVPELMFKNSNA